MNTNTTTDKTVISKTRYQIIAGGRDFTNGAWMTDHVFQAMELAESRGETLVIVSGGAAGADTLSVFASDFWSITNHVFPAQWDEHGRRAGYLRNVEMAEFLLAKQEEGAEIEVVCFPGGVGTQMMRDIAKSLSIPVYQPARPIQS